MSTTTIPELEKLKLSDITIVERYGRSLSRQEVIDLANLYAAIFAAPPWNFDWLRYTDDPENPNSATDFLKKLISFDATLFIGIHQPTNEVVGYTIVLPLCEEALGDLMSDLRLHGNAQIGEVYLAGFGNVPRAQGIHLGREFMLKALEYGGTRRLWLRTREKAVGMVKLSENVAGMHVHSRYQTEQGGAIYERLLYTRPALD